MLLFLKHFQFPLKKLNEITGSDWKCCPASIKLFACMKNSAAVGIKIECSIVPKSVANITQKKIYIYIYIYSVLVIQIC